MQSKLSNIVMIKLAIVSAASGDFLDVSVAPISGEKWGGSARALRALFRPKIWQNKGELCPTGLTFK